MKSSPRWLYFVFVLLFFWGFYLICWRLLTQRVLRVGQCVTCASCMALGSVTLIKSSKKWWERWLTSSKISNDVDGKPCSRYPWGKRSQVECFQRSSRVKVLGIDSNERPIAYYIAFYCLLYCILLSTGFTVRKLYYVSILFYYASVFDFPKYKKLYIALCYGRKILPSLKY